MFLAPPTKTYMTQRITTLKKGILKCSTVEPRFNKVAGDRPNLFVKWRVRYIEVLFHTFYCNFDIEIISFVISRTSLNSGSLNQGSTVPLNTSMSENRNILSWDSHTKLLIRKHFYLSCYMATKRNDDNSFDTKFIC